MKEDKLIYLAIPYAWNAEESFKIANQVAGELMCNGYVVFSPVSHSHPISLTIDEETQYGQDFWMKQDLPILGLCDKMVLTIIGKDGFELIKNSSGCQSEIKYAEENNIPITYYYYDGERKSSN